MPECIDTCPGIFNPAQGPCPSALYDDDEAPPSTDPVPSDYDNDDTYDSDVGGTTLDPVSNNDVSDLSGTSPVVCVGSDCVADEEEVVVDDGGTTDLVLTDNNGDRIGSLRIKTRGPAVITVRAGESEDDDDVVSSVIDVTVDGELDGDSTLCFVVDESRSDLRTKGCLGFYNDENEWECEDACLDVEDDEVCGKTSHFSTFAILLGGAGSAAGGCGVSTAYNGIFSKVGYDIALGAGVMGLVLCCCLIIIIVVMFVPPARRFVYGKEGHRIRKLRSLNDSSTPNSVGSGRRSASAGDTTDLLDDGGWNDDDQHDAEGQDDNAWAV